MAAMTDGQIREIKRRLKESRLALNPSIAYGQRSDDIADLLTKNAELSAENGRLRKVVCDYARHSHDCEIKFRTSADYNCFCGYDDKVLPIVSALPPDVPESEGK